ncbi:MAG: hypothetical protein J6B00_02010 [Alphaproteobacteria bacterium]|nr:hypothetical protein [Alphaproteobacteria bacterium]MBP3688269.1 hypothetical protein [Alphaproteobacteria bacterium]
MSKRILITFGFVLVFGIAAFVLFYMKGRPEPVLEEKNFSEEVHSYRADDLNSGCALDDKVFCAIERAVKCTMAPEFEGCDKKHVPSFVLGKIKDVVRPTEMSFKIVKIKPIIGEKDIAVYTQSDCDTIWFGLCKGTVVYSLSPKGDDWAVTNIYALE